MMNTSVQVPIPKNEPVLGYAPGSPEKKKLKEALKTLAGNTLDVPLIINGQEVRTGKIQPILSPHNHTKPLGQYHLAGPAEIEKAIQGSAKAYREWSRFPWEERAAVILKAAELLAGKHRWTLNAATMLGQGKTCHQAEIDSACELTDFYRFNVAFQKMLYSIQPESAAGMWNTLEYRPLEGFVFAVTPFNFTAIAGNLPTAPALMGNVALWKPSSTAVYSGYYVMKLLEEAGMPPGVIQFLPSSSRDIAGLVLGHRDLAGVHFTGSTEVFQSIWKTVGENISKYKSYPRLVGETGGKDFVFAHASADTEALVAALVRGAYEYQGQKCSAASRAYIPKSVWAKIKDPLVAEIGSIRMGDVSDFTNFMGAVIDEKSFGNIQNYLDYTKKSSDAKILAGGEGDKREGYFIQPTLIHTTDPKFKTMQEEIFGPVLTVYVYDEDKFSETLKLCDETSPYALTGAIFSQDRVAMEEMKSALTHSAGNFYINNKPTGAIVGQQPFGGGRGSGTNDKAGSVFNLIRWTSLKTVSETLNPPVDYRYSFLEEK